MLGWKCRSRQKACLGRTFCAFRRAVMKSSSASFFALSLCLLFLAPSSAFAQVCSAGIGATLPRGFPDCGSSPARLAEGPGVRASWEEPSGGVALRNYALSAEWGNARYRAGALFSWASLDSVYRSAGGSAEFAVAADDPPRRTCFFGRRFFGIGYGFARLWRGRCFFFRRALGNSGVVPSVFRGGVPG